MELSYANVFVIIWSDGNWLNGVSVKPAAHWLCAPIEKPTHRVAHQALLFFALRKVQHGLKCLHCCTLCILAHFSHCLYNLEIFKIQSLNFFLFFLFYVWVFPCCIVIFSLTTTPLKKTNTEQFLKYSSIFVNLTQILEILLYPAPDQHLLTKKSCPYFVSSLQSMPLAVGWN